MATLRIYADGTDTCTHALGAVISPPLSYKTFGLEHADNFWISRVGFWANMYHVSVTSIIIIITFLPYVLLILTNHAHPTLVRTIPCLCPLVDSQSFSRVTLPILYNIFPEK